MLIYIYMYGLSLVSGQHNILKLSRSFWLQKIRDAWQSDWVRDQKWNTGTDHQVPLLADGFYNNVWWRPWCSADFKNALEMERSSEFNNLPDATKSSTLVKVLWGCMENEKDLVILSVREIHYERVLMGPWRTTVLTIFNSEFIDR